MTAHRSGARICRGCERAAETFRQSSACSLLPRQAPRRSSRRLGGMQPPPPSPASRAGAQPAPNAYRGSRCPPLTSRSRRVPSASTSDAARASSRSRFSATTSPTTRGAVATEERRAICAKYGRAAAPAQVGSPNDPGTVSRAAPKQTGAAKRPRATQNRCRETSALNAEWSEQIADPSASGNSAHIC